MGYRVQINVNSYKAVDYSALGGVKITVYLEPEAFSATIETTDSDGWVYINIDRSHWTETDIQRVKVYAEKDGYVKCCVKCVFESTVTDAQDVKNHSFNVDVLMIEAPPVVVQMTP